MEIRLIVDSSGPLAGRLVTLAPDRRDADRGCREREIQFIGWLGLLRALYEVTGEEGGSSPSGS